MESGRHREDRENQGKESSRAGAADTDGSKWELEAHVTSFIIGGMLGIVMLCTRSSGSPGLLILGVLDEDT